MSSKRELDDIVIKDGKYYTRGSQKEFDGSIISRYPSGEIFQETVVQRGEGVASTTYNKGGQVIGQQGQVLKSKERSFGYEDVSAQVRQYRKKNLESFPKFLTFGAIVILLLISFSMISKLLKPTKK